MKNNLLYLVVVLFLLTACSTDNEPEPEKTYLLQRKLSEVTYTNGGGVLIDLSYSYNDKKELVRINGVIIGEDELTPVHTELSYDSQGSVIRVENRLGTVWTNEYNEKNQLVKSTRKYNSTEPFHHLHSYNDKNQLVEIKSYRQDGSSETLVGNTLITYNAENRINITRTTVSNGDITEYTIATDSQIRELPALPHQITAEFGAAEIFAEPYITSNNIMSIDILNKTTNQKNGYGYQAFRTYNEGGLPETCIKNYEHGSVEKISYTYSVK